MEASDAAAVARVLAGDRDAYQVLVERHCRNVFRLVFRMTGSEPDAEDLVQETFLRAYKALNRFEMRANFGTWLHRVAVNCTLDFLRRRQRPGEVPMDAEAPAGEENSDPLQKVPSRDPDPERLLLSAEMQKRLNGALAELSSRERAAFVLRHLEGRSIEEISQMLGLRANAAKNTIFRAVQKLRQALRPVMG
jgi:RNA polymerase sigma-70 factor, ECF subfamily